MTSNFLDLPITGGPQSFHIVIPYPNPNPKETPGLLYADRHDCCPVDCLSISPSLF